jgi:WhiB family transcriptional regulator, redox-sensing transcriptional regulator
VASRTAQNETLCDEPENFIDADALCWNPMCVLNKPLLLPEAEWRERAACLAYPAILFFGLDDNESPVERRTREERAKQVCAQCEVRKECLEYALLTREPYGIWGGLTEIERKARLRTRSA